MTISTRIARGLLVPVALLLAVPASARDRGAKPTRGTEEPTVQQPPGPEQPADPAPNVQEAQMEMMRIQQELAPIEQQALQDPTINQRFEALQERVETAMKEADPKVEQGLARIPNLEQEILAARDAGDQERMEHLLVEATELQVRLNDAHQKVMQRAEIQREYEQFRQALINRMKEIDPRTEQLIQRAELLGEQLMQAS